MIDRIVFRAIRRQMTDAKRATEKLTQDVQLLPKEGHAVAVTDPVHA
jgi:hypothetical protein